MSDEKRTKPWDHNQFQGRHRVDVEPVDDEHLYMRRGAPKMDSSVSYSDKSLHSVPKNINMASGIVVKPAR